MVRLGLVALVVTAVGCRWDGGIGPGFQCGEGDRCPDGESCVNGFCTAAAEPDASAIDASDLDGSVEPVACGTMLMLQDDFENNVYDEVPWYPWDDLPNASPAENGGAAVIQITAGNMDSWAGFDSQLRYDLRGGAFDVDVAQTGGVSTVVEVRSYDGPRAQIYAEGGMIAAGVFNTAGAGTRNEIPFVAANHRYWRIRADDTTMYWELSGNRTDWTELHSEAAPFPLGDVRGVLAAGGQLASASEARYADVNGAAPANARYCPTATLSDDFAAAPFEPSWDNWADSGCTISETGGALQFVSSGVGSVWCGITSRHGFDLTESQFVIDAAGVPGATMFMTEMIVAAIGDDVTNLEIKRENTILHVHQAIDDSDVDAMDVTFNPTDHRFWKISEHAGRIYFEAGPDGTVWNPIFDAPARFDVSKVVLVITVGSYGTGPGSAQTVTINSVNP